MVADMQPRHDEAEHDMISMGIHVASESDASVVREWFGDRLLLMQDVRGIRAAISAFDASVLLLQLCKDNEEVLFSVTLSIPQNDDGFVWNVRAKRIVQRIVSLALSHLLGRGLWVSYRQAENEMARVARPGGREFGLEDLVAQVAELA